MDDWKRNTKLASDSFWSGEDLEEAFVFVKGLLDRRVREVKRNG